MKELGHRKIECREEKDNEALIREVEKVRKEVRELKEQVDSNEKDFSEHLRMDLPEWRQANYPPHEEISLIPYNLDPRILQSRHLRVTENVIELF